MTYIEGIGDEVLLFFTFVIASFGILLFLFLRETFRRSNVSDQRSHINVDGVAAFEDSNNLNLQASSTPAENFQQRTPISRTPDSNLQSESENPNDTEDVTESTRSSEQQITLRLILQEQTINAQVFYSTTLQDLKSQYLQEQLSAGRRIRFISHGQVYENDTVTLQECGVTDNSALHVHISEPPTSPVEAQNEELDLSRMFVPLLGIILGLCWAALIYRPVLFTTFAKCLLYLLSLGWVVITFTTYSNRIPTNS